MNNWAGQIASVNATESKIGAYSLTNANYATYENTNLQSDGRSLLFNSFSDVSIDSGTDDLIVFTTCIQFMCTND